MRKYSGKVGFLLAIVLIMALIVGCSKGPIDNPEPPAEDNIGEGGENIVVDPEPEGETITVKLYYVNEEYVLTGEDSLDRIIPVEREITIGEKSVESIVLSKLQEKPSEQDLSTALDNIKILSVDTAEKIAYVNISGEKLSGGSLQESLVLQQIVYSLTELEGVEAVQILVDGSKRETLMGHIFIEEPLERPDMGY